VHSSLFGQDCAALQGSPGLFQATGDEGSKGRVEYFHGDCLGVASGELTPSEASELATEDVAGGGVRRTPCQIGREDWIAKENHIMTHTNDRRLARIEKRAQHIGMISKPYPKVFRFIDDPEGVKKCRAENPDALIIHRIIMLDAKVNCSVWHRVIVSAIFEPARC
jgi:hypothetical protein